MSREDIVCGDRVDALCRALMETLALFGKVQRRFHPAVMARNGAVLLSGAGGLQRIMAGFTPVDGEGCGNRKGEVLMEASRIVMEAVALFNASGTDLRAGMMNALRAGRKVCRVFELLFPLRHEMPEVDGFFRDGPLSREGAEEDSIVYLGDADDPYARGSAALYVPGGRTGPAPLVVALHGGHGHGRDFLWSWIRQARSTGLFLLAPTSTGETWSIMDPGRDLLFVLELMERLGREYPLDADRVLLTGFSDGGTFCLGCAMRPDARFSAFNPVSCVLPPGDLSLVRSRRIFWIHGVHDWMFPVSRARQGADLLARAGADVTLEVKEDLAHAMPGEECPRVLSWFEPGSFSQP